MLVSILVERYLRQNRQKRRKYVVHGTYGLYFDVIFFTMCIFLCFDCVQLGIKRLILEIEIFVIHSLDNANILSFVLIAEHCTLELLSHVIQIFIVRSANCQLCQVVHERVSLCFKKH